MGRIATDMRPGERKPLAQRVDHQLAGFDQHVDGGAVQAEADSDFVGHGTPPPMLQRVNAVRSARSTICPAMAVL